MTLLQKPFSRRTALQGLTASTLALSLSHAPALHAQEDEAQDLVVGVAADPISMDPRISAGTSSHAMLRHIYEPLVYRSDSMELAPVLAESWTRVDPLIWEFTLRQGVTFHNGEPFNAHAVKYTLDSILDPENTWVNSQLLSYLDAISSVEVVDDFTVQIHMSTPSNGLLGNLTMIFMLPPEAGAEAGDQYTNVAVGSGPYQLVEYASNSQVVVERYDDHWSTPAKSRRITFRIVPETTTRVAGLETGEIHLINNLPTDDITRVEEASDLQVLSSPSTRLIFVGLTADRAPFDDVRVRQAVNYGIDKNVLVNDLLGGYAEVATGPMHPLVPGFNDQLTPYEYDPDRARALLADAGYGDGLTISFGYPSGRYLMDTIVGEVVVGQLAEIGIQAEPETAEWGTFFANRNEDKYDAYLYGLGVPPVTADFAMQWFGRVGFTKYSNATVNDLLAEADATPDEAAANELYREAQAIVWDEAAWAYLYYQPDIYGANSRLSGFAPRVDEVFLLFNAELSG